MECIRLQLFHLVYDLSPAVNSLPFLFERLAQEDGAGAGSNLRLYNIVLVSAQVELTVIVLQHSVGWDIRRN